MRPTEDVLKEAEEARAELNAWSGEYVTPDMDRTAEYISELIAELSAKLRESKERLDHIHHIALGAHDSDRDRTLLSIINEASKPTPPKKED